MFYKKFLPSTLYVKLRENRLTVKNINSGEIYEDEPVAATDNDKKNIFTVGKETHKIKNNVVIINGFSHPRSIINDFFIAEKTLQYAVHKLYQKGFFHLSPIMIIHPMEKVEGGLTCVERRALRELAFGAGAQKVFIWVGRELTDDEVISHHYPLEAGTLFDD